MRKKKRAERKLFQGLNFNDFKWCIDNDFQVYIVPLSNKKNIVDMDTGEIIEEYYEANGLFKIAVRRGGITTGGRDWAVVNGRRFESKETLSEITFENVMDAHNHLNYVYKYLRDKYGRN